MLVMIAQTEAMPPAAKLIVLILVLAAMAGAAIQSARSGNWQQVSSVSITSSIENDTDEQTDTQTDPVSEGYDAIGRLQLDRSRAAIIDTLVLAGWDVGRIRSTLKGDNGTIGIEVAEARKRLGIDVPERTFTSREYVNGRLEEREIPL